MTEQFGIPEDRREAALIYYSLIRAYWRLAEAARLGSVKDNERGSLEAEAMALLGEAAEVVDELGPQPDELVASAKDVLQRIFFEALSAEASTSSQFCARTVLEDGTEKP